MQLVIVESPTKAKTIGKFLGREYIVRSSYGHVRDLPKSKIGVDVKKKFKPTYVIPAKAVAVIDDLKAEEAKTDAVILATDEDREGEAIAWHLAEVLELDEKKTKRIVFHEITKSAIEDALKHPRSIDKKLVDAQQARRILDRLVGYGLSPFLWRKVKYGLSAGRVQSVAVRLVVEREREIQKFNSEEYWSIEAELTKDNDKKSFTAQLIKIDQKSLGKLDINNEKEAKDIVDRLYGAKYQVESVNTKEVTRTPAPPFTTSTLQHEAARKFGMSAKQTMTIAQKLYETGLITYMRTDSVNVASSALQQAQSVIADQFGPQYTLQAPRYYTNKSKGAQEAHEAIRPTDLSLLPSAVKTFDTGGRKLYDIIWKRTLASQMQIARIQQTSVDIEAQNEKREAQSHTFRATGSITTFDGFIRAYTEGRDDDTEEEGEQKLPQLQEKEPLQLLKLTPDQHFTQPPPRYNDATLVKALEAHGVGRPSTYAPTLATIQDREYVEKIEKKYHPTEIGFVVNDLLVENFPEIVDINFTSHVEEEFDHIAEGKIGWVPVLEEFYTPFKKHLDEKEATVEKVTEISTTPCPHCSKMMVIKFGRNGRFLACPDPESKVTLPMPEEAAKIKELEEKTKDERCPICSKPMEVKRGRFGYFLGCVDYPTCKGIAKIFNKTGFKCPACRQAGPIAPIGDIVERKSRGRGRVFYGCSRYPDCTFLMSKKPESEADLAPALQHWKDNPPKPKEVKKSKITS